MISSAYSAFKAAEHLPIERWEAMYQAATDPVERDHMRIAIEARKHQEAQREKG